MLVKSGDKTTAVICDLDGTLAIIESEGKLLRNPYDASHCDEIDLINVPLATILTSLYNNGIKTIFVSGREDIYYEPTIRFIQKLGYPFDNLNEIKLFMRNTKDYRDDIIVKKEIYNKNIKDHYEIICCFDDRPKVIRMWRRIGLYVFDCGKGIEF
jgi:hydroxymethylpyrimidine pyrophosphatase-like HAD family hydrolase